MKANNLMTIKKSKFLVTLLIIVAFITLPIITGCQNGKAPDSGDVAVAFEKEGYRVTEETYGYDYIEEIVQEKVIQGSLQPDEATAILRRVGTRFVNLKAMKEFSPADENYEYFEITYFGKNKQAEVFVKEFVYYGAPAYKEHLYKNVYFKGTPAAVKIFESLL